MSQKFLLSVLIFNVSTRVASAFHVRQLGQLRTPNSSKGNSSQGNSSHGRLRQNLLNMGDVQYTAEMVIGGQKLQAILDSGSFDLLVFSERCQYCGDRRTLYDDDKSSSYKRGQHKLVMEHNFGSGSTESMAAFETIKFDTLKDEAQAFWEVYDAYMPILYDSSFQAIAGIGPPASSVSMARGDLAQMKKELATTTANDTALDKMEDEVASYEKIVDFTREQHNLLENLDMQTFSICLGDDAGSDGTFIWRDDSPTQLAEAFVQVPVVGDLYWSAEMTGAQLGGVDASAVSLGCSSRRRASRRCSAVLDTGTSLIVGPRDAVDEIEAVVKKWAGDCSDLSDLPNFQFKLGGKEFSLPPSSYVGEVCGDYGDLDDDMRRLLPHLEQALSRDDCACVAMVMSEDVPSEYGPMWILGLPFFRKYYTSFQLGAVGDEGKPMAESMSFALADDRCHPTAEKALMREQTRSATRAMKVEATKIRAPRWIAGQQHRRVGDGSFSEHASASRAARRLGMEVSNGGTRSSRRRSSMTSLSQLKQRAEVTLAMAE